MARRKVIAREQILDTAYEIVKSDGFTKLTARHIANVMHCSTQPIYLEFKNMADLKRDVFCRIEKELDGWLVRKAPYHEDPVISVCMGYIEFATVEVSLYRTLSVDDFGSSHRFRKFIYKHIEDAMDKDDSGRYQQLTVDAKKSLASYLWIVTTGLASTITSGLVDHDDHVIESMLQTVIHCLLQSKDIENIFEG